MAAAVVEVACADGKLSWLGVPTFTVTAGSCGRLRRTTRLTMTAAACAAKAPAPATSQSRRRFGDSVAPRTATTTQPRLCSPKCDRARAAGSTPGRSLSAAWTATSAATSPRGASAAAASCMFCGWQQRRLPLLLAGQHRQRVAVHPAHLVEAAEQLTLTAQRFEQQREHLSPVALPIDHTTAVGRGDRHAVDRAQPEPARILGRHVELG